MIVITGASGHLGRRTVELLRDRVDAARIVALSRHPEKVADLGVDTRFADFAAPAGLVQAFDGAERALLISTDAVGARIIEHANAITAATVAGVGHLLYTSVVHATNPGPTPLWADHGETERLLRESGMVWTALRNNLYTEGVLASAIPAVAAGVLATNTGDGRTGYVTRDDCAAVAATLLAEGGFENAPLDVTGPGTLDAATIADVLTRISGRPVRYEPQSDKQAVAAFVAGGMPEDAAWAVCDYGAVIRDGWLDVVTDTVERITGRPPTSVEEFLTGHRSALLAGS